MKQRWTLITRAVLVLAIAVVSGTITGADSANSGPPLRIGFYGKSCPKVESLIQTAVTAHLLTDKTIIPGLLRMFFHDCFVTGCDASLLINSTKGNQSEKEAVPNRTVHGFDLIDTAKAALERACPGIVSCSDIIALATRDAVVLAGGVHYEVPTGRKDGRVSKASLVNLLGASSSVAQAVAAFQLIGLSADDLVTLLGAHTVGVAHCAFFNDRLYNFQGTGKADPTMDPKLIATVKKTCPPKLNGLGKVVALDQGTPFAMDNSFYKQLVRNRGILQLDQELTHASITSQRTNSFAAPKSNFGTAFAQAMVKLGNVGVLTGTQGEIRRICGAIN